MASNDPRFLERAEEIPDDGVTLEEMNALGNDVTTFEDNVLRYFDCAREFIAGGSTERYPSSLDKSRYVFYVANTTNISGSSFPRLEVTYAYRSLLLSLYLVDPDGVVALSGVELPLRLRESSDIEEAFLASIERVKAADPRSPHFATRIRRGMIKFFFRVKAAMEHARDFELAIAGARIGDVIQHVTNPTRRDEPLDISFKAMNIFLGFIAAEVETVSSLEDTRMELPEEPFCYDLYLYMAFRYHMISKAEYRLSRSRMPTPPFTRKIGKAVILLAYAYRVDFIQHWNGVMMYLRQNLRTCNSLYYIRRLVRDSIRSHPTSPYRYMVLLSLISEMTLALYHDKGASNPYFYYLNKAIAYYEASGMMEYETMLQDFDNYRGLTGLADHLNTAWKTVSIVAIDTEILRGARYGNKVRFEQHSPRTSRGDPDSERDVSGSEDDQDDDRPGGAPQPRAAQGRSDPDGGRERESPRMTPRAGKSSTGTTLAELLEVTYFTPDSWKGFSSFEEGLAEGQRGSPSGGGSRPRTGQSSQSQARSAGGQSATPAGRRGPQSKSKKKKSKKSKGKR